MIDQVLNCIVQELNHHLIRQLQINEKGALLGPILDEMGNIPPENQNRLVVSLVRLESDPGPPAFNPKSGRDVRTNPAYFFHLDILISAQFPDYQQALKSISEAISFMQDKPIFTPQNTPGLASTIDKLSVEHLNLSYQDMHHLWATLGAPFRPAVLFKIRGIAFHDIDHMPEVNAII